MGDGFCGGLPERWRLEAAAGSGANPIHVSELAKASLLRLAEFSSSATLFGLPFISELFLDVFSVLALYSSMILELVFGVLCSGAAGGGGVANFLCWISEFKFVVVGGLRDFVATCLPLFSITFLNEVGLVFVCMIQRPLLEAGKIRSTVAKNLFQLQVNQIRFESWHKHWGHGFDRQIWVCKNGKFCTIVWEKKIRWIVERTH